jgi:hypothetical protein
MFPILRSTLLVFAAFTLLLAVPDDPAWSSKTIPQWDERDAKQVLIDSPWVKKVKLEQVRNLSKFERRDGGNWEAGIGPAVGLAGTGLFGPTLQELALERAHARPDLGTVWIRWKSALPVRAAEAKAGVVGSPLWDGDYYAIAVEDVPTPFRWNLASELKGTAFLKRDKKKDLKPTRVVILRHLHGLATVVYLFSRSAEITKNDQNVRFTAQIDRLFVSQFFFPEEMQFQGQPEL